jgi:predicted TIM-barrel fold metal-dependent hydrolase
MLNRRQFMGTVALGAAAISLSSRAAEAPAPKLPFALFDTHAHLISADLLRYPRVTANGGDGPPPAGGIQMPEVEQLLTWMDENNVGGGVAVQRRDTYGVNNFYVLDSADRFRSRLMPVVVLDAADEGTPELMRQYIRERGLAGLRITGPLSEDGSLPWLDSPAARRSWVVAEQHSLVMEIMTTPAGHMPAAIAEYVKLAREYPNVRLVLDHLAWPDAHGAPEYGIDAVHRNLALFPNVYFKFSSLNLEQLAAAKVPAPEVLRRAVDVYGADRVMWGSDVGNSAGTYAGFVRGAIAATSLLNADEQRKLLRDTGMRVFVRGGVRRS